MEKLAVKKLLRIEWGVGILVVILICLLYYTFSSKINPDIVRSRSWTPYQNYLVEAFLKRRLDVYSPGTYDLSLYRGKWYLNWGPAPVLFILPFYAKFGVYASDVFYTLLAGMLNTVIFAFVIQEFQKYFKLNLSFVSKIIAILAFALVSPNFFLSLNGSIWFTSQVISIFYLLLFFLFYFKHLNNLKQLKFLFLASLFFNLAWFSMYTLLFNIFLFFYPLWLLYKRKEKETLKKGLLVVSGLVIIFVLLSAFYNYWRFENIFETGLRYHQGHPNLQPFFATGKGFSLSYLPKNIFYYFFNHLQLRPERPFLRIDQEGNSVFSVYPFLLFLLFIKWKKFLGDSKSRLFFGLAALTLLTNLLVFLLCIATGGAQFGERYFFDLIPLLYLLILFSLREVPLLTQVLVIVYGSFVNIMGSLIFYRVAF